MSHKAVCNPRKWKRQCETCRFCDWENPEMAPDPWGGSVMVEKGLCSQTEERVFIGEWCNGWEHISLGISGYNSYLEGVIERMMLDYKSYIPVIISTGPTEKDFALSLLSLCNAAKIIVGEQGKLSFRRFTEKMMEVVNDLLEGTLMQVGWHPQIEGTMILGPLEWWND